MNLKSRKKKISEIYKSVNKSFNGEEYTQQQSVVKQFQISAITHQVPKDASFASKIHDKDETLINENEVAHSNIGNRLKYQHVLATSSGEHLHAIFEVITQAEDTRENI